MSSNVCNRLKFGKIHVAYERPIASDNGLMSSNKDMKRIF